MQLTTSLTFALAVFAGLATAAPSSLQRRDAVSCEWTYGGTLTVVGGTSGIGQKITLSSDTQDTLTTDFQAAGNANPGADDVSFVFSQCTTTAADWNDADDNQRVGQLKVYTTGTTFGTPWPEASGGGCVTVDYNTGGESPRMLYVEACATSTDDVLLPRQWFSVDNWSLPEFHDNTFVTLYGRGAPTGENAYKNVAQIQSGVAVGGEGQLVLQDVYPLLRSN